MNETQRELFARAYERYCFIAKKIGTVYEEEDYTEDRIDIESALCSFDLYLQCQMIRLAAANGFITTEELDFIIDLPDNIDLICSRTKGYRKFLNTLTASSFTENGGRFYNERMTSVFFDLLKQNSEQDIPEVIAAVQDILKCLIRIDNCGTSESQAASDDIIKNLTIGEPAAQKKTNMLKFGSEADTLKELNSLIGLDSVKKDVNELIGLLKINQLREEQGLPQLQVNLHMVFTGAPGTGKTTVARLLAKLYGELGVLSSGHLVETDRSGLVAGYVGQTAIKTAQMIKKAKGGVLFIDEAYALSDLSFQNDFGIEAIDMLVKGMEDNRDDLIVIVAGYKDKMNQFIESNPGLRSRFNKYISFPDYTPDELMRIFEKLCIESKFILCNDAARKAQDLFDIRAKQREFGNARGVRNVFEQTVIAQAMRLLSKNTPTATELQTITEDDINW